jgi:hypothetical protein
MHMQLPERNVNSFEVLAAHFMRPQNCCSAEEQALYVENKKTAQVKTR